jgi:ABC-type antimicrobial peptide transport system permease subunit
VSYSVSRRTNEIGIRLALGASASAVRWMVLRETLVLVVIGLAAGLAVSLPAMSVVGSLLYGLSPRDPSTIVFSMGVLLTIGLVSGAIPAWRASRVEPTAALRAE